MSQTTATYGLAETVMGTYGLSETPTEIFVYDNLDGMAWYVCKGSKNVNLCSIHWLEKNVKVELIQDYDHMTSSDAIESIEELIKFIES